MRAFTGRFFGWSKRTGKEKRVEEKRRDVPFWYDTRYERTEVSEGNVSHRKALSQWEQQVSTHLGHLSRPQAHVLALWSYGMVLAKSCGITSVAAVLAQGLGSSLGTLRQQLREWCYDAADKKGIHRQEVDVTLCFGPLLGWIVSKWPPLECRLALGMDATTLSDRFTVLCVSVLYRGCAIPVAWKLLCSGEKGAWEPYWKALFTSLQGKVPKGWTVIVLADRGLYAPWLYRHLVSLGWHPFLRIKPSRQSTSAGGRALRLAFDLGAQAGNCLEWGGGLLCGADGALYVVGLLGGRLHRCLVGDDRSGSRGGKRWCGTACAAGSKGASKIPNAVAGNGTKPR